MSHDLNETLIFVKVVEQGSFIAAAKSLGLPKTTVSRKVQELETRLGARLLHRTTRRLGLTEAGSIYHEHCQRIARELEEAESAVSQLQSGPRGWLRFTVPYSIGITWIAPLLGQFHAQYPEIRLDMHMGNEKLDLIAGEADLALRVGALPDSNLVARKLGSLRTQVFASPAYIERYGEPLHPEELQFHRILAMRKPYHTGNSPRFTWQLGENGGELRDFPVTPLMTANDMSALNGALVWRRPAADRRCDGQAVRRVGHGAPRAGRLDRPGSGLQRRVRRWPPGLAEGACVRRLPGRKAQLRRQLHAGAVPGREAGTAAEGAGRRRAGKQRQADPGEGGRFGGGL
jgi:DNA-binding transcriptional LysR family regulator